MENDSLMTGELTAEPVLDSAALPADSNGTLGFEMPSAEQLGISISSGWAGAQKTVMVGDTFDFPVTVSWSVNGSSLLVLPTGSASAKGIAQVGVSQESARAVKDGKEIASVTFTYKIVAQDTGDLNVPVMKFEIPTQVGVPLTLRSESVPVRVESPASILPVLAGGVVTLIVLLAGFWRTRRRAVARVAAANKVAKENALREKMLVLKQRVGAADSRDWLLELESLCKDFAAMRLGNAADLNLENLVKSDEIEKLGDRESWSALVELFAQARYGGGKRDAFENRETWKLAMKLMGLEEE